MTALDLDQLISELMKVRHRHDGSGNLRVVMCTAGGSGECGQVEIALDTVSGELEVLLLEVT